jgi:hypothetical protein
MKTKTYFINFTIIASALLSVLTMLFTTQLIVLPLVQNQIFQHTISTYIPKDNFPGDEVKLHRLSVEVKQLSAKLAKLNPGKQYLLINTSDNTFKMIKNGAVFHEGICSTGSYVKLEVEGNKTYKFETPRGVFTVKSKIVDPVWKKPDWAFAEEGLPIPPANHDSRFEYGVLGDYALNLGNGYLIHGTLYQRFLGMPVTHGCVRLGDADLEFLYNELPVGAKVFIY